MTSDSQRLLSDFSENGSETAFRDLVIRYTNLVYSVAVRLVDGDTSLAASFLPDGAVPGLTPDQFEITYQGSLNDLTNRQSVIVLREKEAVQDADGGAHRAYGFADGHSEIHKAVDGNFQPWEQQHMIAPR